MSKLDDLEAVVIALKARADSLMRADGATKSGTKTLVSSEELDFGKLGYGEVEFYIKAVYKIDFEFKSIKSIDWTGNDDKPDRSPPRAAIETRLKRLVEQKFEDLMDDLKSWL